MGNWYNFTLIARGAKAEVKAFADSLLKLPFFNELHPLKDDEGLYEGGSGIWIEKPQKWRADIVEQEFSFMSKSYDEDVTFSKSFPSLCFLQVSDGHDISEYSSRFIFRGNSRLFRLPEEIMYAHYEPAPWYGKGSFDFDFDAISKKLIAAWDETTLEVLQNRKGIRNISASSFKPRGVDDAVRKTNRIENLTTLKGKQVALTGKLTSGSRKEITARILRKGGKVTPNGKVTANADVLVRGDSPQFKYGSHGIKEQAAADFIRAGKPLVIIEDEEFEKFLKDGTPARCSDVVAGEQIVNVVPPPNVDTFLEIAEIEGPLDREHTAKGRTEQAYLRRIVFEGKEVSTCSLCGKEFPTRLMVAAHIKPRSECDEDERRDAAQIAFGLCLLGCDALYEQGYVSVDGKGRIVTVADKYLPAALRQRLKDLNGRICPKWRKGSDYHPEPESYFSWHLRRRFLGQSK